MSTSDLRYIDGVVTVALDRTACTGCRMCTIVCPHGVFEMSPDGRATLAGRDRCIECGACARNCPAAAISVDAGVGCAAAVIYGWLTSSEPSCGCD